MHRTIPSLLPRRLNDLHIGQSGITGLETAIVLIAFVVVAAVFAFTVLTTGLFTSEKAKETVMSGVSSQSSLELVGSVIAGGTNLGNTCRTAAGPVGPANRPPVAGAGVTPFEDLETCDMDWNGWDANPPQIHVQTIRFTLKPALGAGKIPFNPNDLLITYSDGRLAELFNFVNARAGNTVTPDNADIRDHSPTSPEWDRCRSGWPATGDNDRPNFCISWGPNSNQDFVLEAGETVEIFLYSPGGNNPIHSNNQWGSYVWGPGRKFMIEVIPPQGSILSFERRLPDVFRHVMDLG